MAFTEDLGAFFSQADFAVPLIWGLVTAEVILDAPDQEIIEGRVLSRGYEITYSADALVGLASGAAVTVDGNAYTVRAPPETLDDGKIMRAKLRRN